MEIILQSPFNPVCFEIFTVPIRWYGIILSFALFVGIFLTYCLIKKYTSQNEADKFIDFSPMLILTAIIGARFFYVIGDWDFYSKYPKEIILINHGGISIYGAIIFGLLFFVIYSHVKKINTLKYLDFFAISMPLAQSIGRWGNFFNQEAYGFPTNSFLKLFILPHNRLPQYINIDFYHPVFLYESFLDFIIFCILLFLFLKYKKLKKGTILCLYLLLYSTIRFFIEFIRIDSVVNIYGYHIAQIISILIFILALILLFLINKKGE